MNFLWIANYGDTPKIADNSGNTKPPCFCALSEKHMGPHREPSCNGRSKTDFWRAEVILIAL